MRIRINDSAVDGLKAWARESAAADPASEPPRILAVAIEESEADAAADDYEKIVAAARDLYCNDECEIDDDAVLSRGDDGVWVAAWVHVSHEVLGRGEGDDE